ncbi:MAG: type II toxin-antitoxin system RelE/ParE family toxin [Bacteroidetes bacterium]|nr:type II toxin-antitoxin system RelE/ParE family toxin [Bacteroidota bacterium]
MPSRYKLRYLPVAQDDLISIFDHIAEDSVNRALGFVEKLDRTVGLLEGNPLLGRTPRHEKLREYGYRVLIVESYLVFYVIRGHTTEVHRVVHASRSLDHLI